MGIQFDTVARSEKHRRAAQEMAKRLGFKLGLDSQLAEEIFIAGMNYQDDTTTNKIILNEIPKRVLVKA